MILSKGINKVELNKTIKKLTSEELGNRKVKLYFINIYLSNIKVLNEEQLEAVQERKLEIFRKKIDEKKFFLEKHEAIKEIKMKLLLINKSQNNYIQFQKFWSVYIILLGLYQSFHHIIKVFFLFFFLLFY